MAGCVVTVRVALVTVSVDVPVLAPNWLSPAKLTPSAPTYVPALIGIEFCTRLTLGSVATPVALVTAVPTTSPLTENVIERPTTAVPLEVRCNVVESVVVPKYAPVEFATIKFVADCGAETVTTDVAALLVGLVSTADELLAAAVLVMVSPLSNVLSVDPTSVTVPDCPLASEANVMVRFRPGALIANASWSCRAGNKRHAGPRQKIIDRHRRCAGAVVGDGDRVRNLVSGSHRVGRSRLRNR